MKSKEVKNSVSPGQGQAQTKASLGINLKDEPGSVGQSPPSIKSDPDAPPIVNGENNVSGGGAATNCDNPGGTPPTPGPEAGDRDAATPSSLAEDKKPVIPGSGPPSNCNTGNGLIKSETDFLDTFDSKDGGEFSLEHFIYTK